MSKSTVHRHHHRIGHGPKTAQAGKSIGVCESLEDRRLLSGTWSTVDAYQLSPGKFSEPDAMVSDSTGNIFVAGRAGTASGSYDGVIREKAAGSSTWTTIEDTNAVVNFSAIAVDASGDLFAAAGPATGAWQIWERPAGQTAFTVIDNLGAHSGCHGLGTDSSGDVFAVGGMTETVMVKKNTYTSQNHWVVRKMTGGTGSFKTIDDLYGGTGNSTAQAVSVVPGGAGAGIYVVGATNTPGGYPVETNWLVRRSTDGGHTWATVDNYNPTQYGAGALAVTADLSGNIFVAGYQDTDNQGWVVRESSTGMSGSWTTTDSFRLGSTSRSLANAIGVDALGNVYVTGLAADPATGLASSYHDIVRTNIGGAWTTVDDLQAGSAYGDVGFAVDTSGNLYVAGQQKINNVETWIVRSSPGPTASVAGMGLSATAAASTAFSSTLITASNMTRSDDSDSWLKTADDPRLP